MQKAANDSRTSGHESTEGVPAAPPSIAAMRTAVELEIQAALGHVQTRAIGEMIQKAIDATVGWQPIETAPKDGNVLVADSGEVTEAYYDGESDMWFRAGKHPNDFDFVRGDRLFPTHWMPLPEPPK